MRSRREIPCLLALALLGLCGPSATKASAQYPTPAAHQTRDTAGHRIPSVHHGSKVRLYVPALSAQPVEGRVEHVSGMAMTLRSDLQADPIRVPLADVERLEVSQGRGAKPVVFAVTGFAVGGLVGLAVAPSRNCSNMNLQEALGCALDPAPAETGLAIGALGGGLLGLVIGTAASPERWTTVPVGSLSLRLGPNRAGPFGASFAARF